MAYKGRLTKQVEEAISLLREEGSIVIPMNNTRYEAPKEYKFCVVEQIQEIQGNINWQVQARLFEAVREELIKQNKNITTLLDEGIIRLK